MHGLLGGFTSMELAQIRAGKIIRGSSDACRSYAENRGTGGTASEAAAIFCSDGEPTGSGQPTHQFAICWEIWQRPKISGSDSGTSRREQRLANVEMLLAKSKRDYEKISYHGLFHFVRYIERMKKYQMDFGEAAMTGKSGEAVQIMSTHHSKGLGFPVVFAAGLGKTFNKQDAREKVVCHNRVGS